MPLMPSHFVLRVAFSGKPRTDTTSAAVEDATLLPEACATALPHNGGEDWGNYPKTTLFQVE